MLFDIYHFWSSSLRELWGHFWYFSKKQWNTAGISISFERKRLSKVPCSVHCHEYVLTLHCSHRFLGMEDVAADTTCSVWRVSLSLNCGYLCIKRNQHMTGAIQFNIHVTHEQDPCSKSSNHLFLAQWIALYFSRSTTFRQLIDLEWKFGVTAANDDLLSVGATYLQMKLVIDRGTGQVYYVA